MKFVVVSWLVICAFVLGGCAPVAVPTGVSPAISPIPTKSRIIRVGFSTSTDMGDVPSLMAHELLTAQGYTIEVTAFTSADLETAALMQGAIDIANGSMRTVWLGIGKGGNARTLMEQVADAWLLVAKIDIKTCGDLAGKRIAFTSSSSLNHALFDAYTQEYCPRLEYEPLLISSSENRAAALLAGQVDATPLELADWIEQQEKAPDRFHVLFNFGEQLPRLKTTGVYARGAFAEQQPEAVRDYIRALLAVHRAIRDNTAQLRDAAAKYLHLDSTTAETIAQAYLALNMWDPNGGLTREDVQYSLDFFTKTNSIPEGMTVDSVADLSYLRQVLDEIGRK